MKLTVFSTMMGDDMLVTLADIARETGTSISAVSAALKGNRSTAKVSEETRRRVIEEAKRLGYRPSHAARSLRSGRTGIFGFITSEIQTPYYGEIASILMAEADRYEYSVLINATGGNPERQFRAFNRLRDGRCDGLILLDGELLENYPSIVNSLIKNAFPIVLINNPRSEFSSVNEDWGVGFGAAADYLRGRGITDAVFFGYRIESRERAKLKALLRACTGAGISLRFVESGSSLEQAQAYGRSLAAMTVRPRVIFAESDVVAMPLMKGIHDVGLRIPEDVGVIGCDDMMLRKFNVPSMATIGFDKVEVGKQVISTLFEILDKRSEVVETINIPTTFIQGESV